ncbi:hypothetical protein JCM11251_000297 [Rhodosporidiobolus azoricus]
MSHRDPSRSVQHKWLVPPHLIPTVKALLEQGSKGQIQSLYLTHGICSDSAPVHNASVPPPFIASSPPSTAALSLPTRNAAQPKPPGSGKEDPSSNASLGEDVHLSRAMITDEDGGSNGLPRENEDKKRTLVPKEGQIVRLKDNFTAARPTPQLVSASLPTSDADALASYIDTVLSARLVAAKVEWQEDVLTKTEERLQGMEAKLSELWMGEQLRVRWEMDCRVYQVEFVKFCSLLDKNQLTLPRKLLFSSKKGGSRARHKHRGERQANEEKLKVDGFHAFKDFLDHLNGGYPSGAPPDYQQQLQTAFAVLPSPRQAFLRAFHEAHSRLSQVWHGGTHRAPTEKDFWRMIGFALLRREDGATKEELPMAAQAVYEERQEGLGSTELVKEESERWSLSEVKEFYMELADGDYTVRIGNEEITKKAFPPPSF